MARVNYNPEEIADDSQSFKSIVVFLHLGMPGMDDVSLVAITW
jgi:hypothetical protein